LHTRAIAPDGSYCISLRAAATTMAAAAVSTPASAISVAAATGAATITVHKITSAFEIRSTPYFILCAVLYLRDKKLIIAA